MEETTYELTPARKTFSRIGFALTAILLIATVLQALWLVIPPLIWGQDNWLTASSWGVWIGSFAPIYLVAIPVSLLIFKKAPAQPPQEKTMGTKNFLVFLPICFCVMYGGNIIGTVLSLVLSGGSAQNTVAEYAMDTNPLKILVMVILAPVLEEYVCRKQIIDRTRQYGEKTAVLLSGLTFGLLHQNLFQFFYAFGLGLIFGYVYIRTGRLRYSIGFHAIINFMGSVIAPMLLGMLDLQALENLDPNAPTAEIMELYSRMMPGMILFLLYFLFLIVMFIAGLILLIIRCKKLIWKEAPNQLPTGTGAKTVYLNPGMVIYILLCAAAMVISLL